MTTRDESMHRHPSGKHRRPDYPVDVQVTVLSLYGALIPLANARTAEDYEEFVEWLNGEGEGWTMRLRTECIVPAPGLLAGAR